MVQCAHREHPERGIGACHHAGYGIDGPVPSASHNPFDTLPDGSRRDRAELFAASNYNLDVDAGLAGHTGDHATRLLSMNGRTVENVNRTTVRLGRCQEWNSI
jgi:hypothetical protein